MCRAQYHFQPQSRWHLQIGWLKSKIIKSGSESFHFDSIRLLVDVGADPLPKG